MIVDRFGDWVIDDSIVDEPPRARAQSRTCCSTRTTRWTGIRGAKRRSRRRAPEDKPIFLSIGYSTCHWCHVMEHESFENAEVAAVLNDALRLDQGRPRGAAGRRSRLHDLRAGDDRIGRLADERLADAGPEAVLRRHLLSAGVALGAARASSRSCSEIARVVAGRAGEGRASRPRRGHEPAARARARRPSRASAPGADGARRTRSAQFRDAFDRRHGGFGDAPKFPRPSELLFLLREHARTGDADGARDGAAHAARDGARRHARPRRRRLPPLLGRRRLARAALREDALRPGAARARVPRRRAGVGRSVLRRGRRGHAARTSCGR